MATFGTESLPMLEEYFFKALSDGDTVKAEIIRQQILDIKKEAEPTPTSLDSGRFAGTEDDPLYPFF